MKYFLKYTLFTLLILGFAQALAASPPSMSLPACEEVDGEQTGACPQTNDNFSGQAAGSLSAGAQVAVTISPNVPVCDYHNGYPPYDWSPSPCYSAVDSSPDVLGCGYIDLQDDNRWKESSCASALFEDPYDINSPNFTVAPLIEGNSCTASGNYGTYIYGGAANVPGARWVERGPNHLSCGITFNGPRPDGLNGPTWVKLRVGLSIAENGDERRGYAEYAEFFVPIEGDLRDLGPVADFTYSVDKNEVVFTNTSYHPNGDQMNYQWQFGDSATSTNPNPVHAYDRGGQYQVQLKVTDSDGDESLVSVPVEVEDPGTEFEISTDQGRYYIETNESQNQYQEGIATLTVSTEAPLERTVEYGKPVLTIDDETIVEIKEVESEARIISKELGAAKVEVPLKALKPGATRLRASVEVKTVDGETETLEAELPIVVSPLKVSVSVDPEQFKVNDTEESELSEACRNYVRPEPEEDQSEKVANCVEITMVLENVSEDTISNINILDQANITKAIKSLDPERIDIPLLHLHYIPPTNEEGEVLPNQLEEGEKKTYRFLVEAFGGSPWLEVRPVVRATLNGEQIQSSGTAEFKLIEDVLLKFGAKFTEPNRNTLGGAPIRLEGFFENYSTTNWVAATVFPFVEDNAGRGHLYDPTKNNIQIATFNGTDCRRFAEVDASKLPEFFVPILIPPKEEESEEPSRVDLEGVLATMCWDVDSLAKVKYVVHAYTLETDENGDLVSNNVDGEEHYVQKDSLVDQVEYVEEDGYDYKLQKTIGANPDIPLTDSFCDELEWLDQYLQCEAARGVHSFGVGMMELPGFLISSTKYVIESNVNYGAQLLHWTANQTVTGFKAAFGDDYESEQAKAKLYAEARLILSSLERAAIITAEQQESIAVSAGDAFVGVIKDFENGNYRQLAGRTAFVAGDNIDAILTGGAVKVLAARVQKGFRAAEASGELGNIEKAVQDGLEQISTRRSQAEVDKIATDAAGKGEDILTNGDLKPNDPISYDFIHKYSGVSRDTVKKIEAIAQKYKVQIAFRSRGVGAIEKIKQGLAYWKPMPIKQKNVNRLDVKYLGYPEEALDTVLIVEPPIKPGLNVDITQDGWSKSEGFTRQLDQWMREKTGIEKPQGLENLDARLAQDSSLRIDEFVLPDNFDEYMQVRERLRTRVEEWVKYTSDDNYFGPDLQSGKMLTEGIDMGFGFKDNGLSPFFDAIAPRDNLAGSRRKLFLEEGFRKSNGEIISTVEGTDRRIFELKMDGPLGPKNITGDIDFLTILDSTGALIRNPVRRFFIYLDLATSVGMQHGESFTLAYRSARAKFLEAHVLGRNGSEALVNIAHHSDGTPRRRASFFVRHRAITEDLGNGLVRLDIDQHFIPITSAGQTLRTARDVANAAFSPKTYYSQLSSWLDLYLNAVWPLRHLSNAVEDLDENEVSGEFDSDSSADDSQIIQPRDGTLSRLEEVVETSGTGQQKVSVKREMSKVANSQKITSGALALRWRPIAIEEAKNANGLVSSLPISVLELPVVAGSQILEFADLAALDMPDSSPFFAVGQTIAIDPTLANAEVAVIESLNPIQLKTPLLFPHEAGAMIAVLPDALTDESFAQVDSDGDGVIDAEDAFPDDASETLDTDSDGIGNNADEDDDGDGTSDVDEQSYGSDPLLAEDTPEQHRPLAPMVLSVVAETGAPLTQLSIDASSFDDPDEDGTASAIALRIVSMDQGAESGVVYQGEVSGLSPLTLPAGLILPNKDYALLIGYVDASGLASEYSEAALFSTEANDPADTNANGIEDSAEYSGGTPDFGSSSDPVQVVVSAENAEALGISSDPGLLSFVGTQSAANAESLGSRRFPYGLVELRIDGLDPGASVVLHYYFETELDAASRWQQYRVATHELVELSDYATISGKRIEVMLVDGGEGDLDGTANGVLITASGLSLSESISSGSGSGGGGGGGAVGWLTLFVLLMCCAYRELYVPRERASQRSRVRV